MRDPWRGRRSSARLLAQAWSEYARLRRCVLRCLAEGPGVGPEEIVVVDGVIDEAAGALAARVDRAGDPIPPHVVARRARSRAVARDVLKRIP